MNKNTPRVPYLKNWKIPYSDKIFRVIQEFSLTEKVVFFFFVTLLCISAVMLLWRVNKSFLVEVPEYGGSLTEGILGSPRFINPLLAISDIDRDLTSLVYSGLLKTDPDGALVPDLAQSYTITDDGRTYTFKLKDNVHFHDGVKVTADDVVFTIEQIKDPLLKSPRKTNWDGVTVNKIDDTTIEFSLHQPYSPFIQNLTLGILPKHIWKTATADEFPFSQYNIKPVGSGPYKITNIAYTSGGLPSEYTFSSFHSYALGRPYIDTITVKAYPNEKDIIDAFRNGDVQSIYGITPQKLSGVPSDSDMVMVAPLPRVFGVFFNQNMAPVLVNKEVRMALSMATDKKQIVDTVLGGYGQSIIHAIPPKILAETEGTRVTEEDIADAKALLEKNGWKLNDDGIYQKTDKKQTTLLQFSLSTSAAPELKAVAQMLQEQWRKIGAQVDIKIFEVGDLNQNIIRPRKYDALLFGEVIGRDLDLYPFWHSSGRVDPGLNIALYTSLRVDKILEDIRRTTDGSQQEVLYKKFNTEIESDLPAIFIYSPYFIYIVPNNIHNIHLGQLTTPGERWNGIHTWYIETSNVWKLFAK
ncbi:MAG: peptide/nickel transport system substrate-binding protein [Patescibacteria group bacterium]|nr:peptide/nickel transport system substrate-binding protein [Patescibacteria group bacterium]